MDGLLESGFGFILFLWALEAAAEAVVGGGERVVGGEESFVFAAGFGDLTGGVKGVGETEADGNGVA